jgi:hypothetical protein
LEKITEIDEKRLRKKVARIKTVYEEGCSQPKLATPSWPPYYSSLLMIF